MRGNDVVGALYADATEPREVAAPETVFFEAVANLAAVALGQ